MQGTRRVRFVSGNEHKLREAREILEGLNVEVVPVSRKIEELQTSDARGLVHDKLIRAFRILRRPLFVEHTGLELRDLQGLPGGLTQIFWDTLQADRFSELFGGDSGSKRCTARTTIAYCDGKRVHFFSGDTAGCIVHPPRGDRAFQWDCVFEPAGYTQTFAEMGSTKNDISMRRRALDEFAKYLQDRENST